ncbi:MAG: glycosyltransferase family 39 protein, partial [Ilumatobacteraceae bacterium]
MSADHVPLGGNRRDRVLAAVTSAAVVFAARLWVSRGHEQFAVWPDEPAQLAIARFVGGGTRWNMHNHSVWRPLFGTLLSPIHWFTDDPATVLQAAFVLNAVLGALAAVLMVVLVRRLTSMSAWWSAVGATLVSLSPAVLLTSNFVFSESLVLPAYLATLVAVLRFHDAPSLRRAALAGVLAGVAFGAHSRMLPLAVAVVGMVVFALVRRRLTWYEAAAGVAVTIVSILSMVLYTSWLVDQLWNVPSDTNSVGEVMDQASNGPALIVSLVGQTWSLLVASVGVIAYGAVALVRSALGVTVSTGAHVDTPDLGPSGAAGRVSDDRSGLQRADAIIVLLVAAACIGLSVAFMSDRFRSDQLVYG